MKLVATRNPRIQAPDGSWHQRRYMPLWAQVTVVLVVLLAIAAGVGWSIWHAHQENDRVQHQNRLFVRPRNGNTEPRLLNHSGDPESLGHELSDLSTRSQNHSRRPRCRRPAWRTEEERKIAFRTSTASNAEFVSRALDCEKSFG